MDFKSPKAIMQQLHDNNSIGLYFIRAKSEEAIQKISSELYSEWVAREKPSLDPLYIGKATGNGGLRSRLNQELYHRGAGTFFRSLGAIMGKLPIIRGTSPNYRFDDPAKTEIINFIESDLEVAVIYMDDVNLILAEESRLVKANKPIFNIQGNTNPAQAIILARKLCSDYAAGNLLRGGMSTELLLHNYHFTALKLIEEDGSVTLSLSEIDLIENAPTEEEAMLALAQSILDYAKEFHREFNLWSNAPNRKTHLPYVVKALILGDTRKIMACINSCETRCKDE